MIATLITMTAAVIAAPTASYSQPFLAKDHQLVLLHGRRTVAEARIELEKIYPGRVAFVTNGGYFDTDSKKAVGLLVINGEKISDPLNIGRPILAIGETKATIFTGEGRIPFQKWEDYREIGGFVSALEGDKSAIEPSRPTYRQVLVVRNGAFLFIQMRNANQTYCNKVISDCGLKLGEYMYLDGGSSMMEGVATTSQVGVIRLDPPDGQASSKPVFLLKLGHGKTRDRGGAKQHPLALQRREYFSHQRRFGH